MVGTAVEAENLMILSKKCEKLRLHDVVIKGELTDTINLKSVHSIDCSVYEKEKMEYLLSNANNAKVINTHFGIINNTLYPNAESIQLINIDNHSFDNQVQSIIRYVPKIKSLNIIRSDGGNVLDKKTINTLNQIKDVS